MSLVLSGTSTIRFFFRREFLKYKKRGDIALQTYHHILKGRLLETDATTQNSSLD